MTEDKKWTREELHAALMKYPVKRRLELVAAARLMVENKLLEHAIKNGKARPN